MSRFSSFPERRAGSALDRRPSRSHRINKGKVQLSFEMSMPIPSAKCARNLPIRIEQKKLELRNEFAATKGICKPIRRGCNRSFEFNQERRQIYAQRESSAFERRTMAMGNLLGSRRLRCGSIPKFCLEFSRF